MSPLADGTLEDYDWELLYVWQQFSQDWNAETFVGPSVESVGEFAEWMKTHPVTEETKRMAASWWAKRDLGPLSVESDLITLWMEFSEAEYFAGFMTLGPETARHFARWLISSERREPSSE